MKIKKIAKANELMWVLGVIFVALGVSICSKADLGVSMIAAPAFIINDAVSSLWDGFSVGMMEYLVQGVMLIILCIVVQRANWRYLLAFLVAIIYGYVLDLWLFIFKDVYFEEIYMQWIMLIVGDVITALGVACFFKTYLPLQVYELCVAEVSDRYKFDIHKTKWAFDMLCLVLSIILAFAISQDAGEFDWSTIYKSSYHHLGLGTIVTTLINAPIIAGWSKLLDKCFTYEALLPKVQKYIGRNNKEEVVIESAEVEDDKNWCYIRIFRRRQNYVN